MYRIICFLLIILSLFIACRTYTVTAKWEHSSPTEIKGFKIYCGKYSRQYTYIFDLGAVVPYKVENGRGFYTAIQKFSDSTYRNCKYCAMTAYTDIKESRYSNEVSWKDSGIMIFANIGGDLK